MSEPRINLIGGNAYSFTGGIQTVNRTLVRELAEGGLLRQAFFLWDSPGEVSAEGREAARLGRVSFHARNRGSLLRALTVQAIRHPGDVWLSTHVNYAVLALYASAGRSRHAAVLMHADELDIEFTPLKGWALRRMGLAIAVSEYTRRKALRLGVEPPRARVLLNAVEHAPAPAAPAMPRGPVVLFVGRMDERYKGQRDLLDAMVRLRPHLPALRLVFIGGGQSIPAWQAEAASRGLGACVEFRGRVSDAELAQAYAEATVFAMPSENEGFGLVYAEAMARGLPCIGSTRDAAGEVISDGETGLLVPVGDPAALADAIRRIIETPGLQQQMGEAGRQRYLGVFTPESYRRRLWAMMYEWLGQVAPAPGRPAPTLRRT